MQLRDSVLGPHNLLVAFRTWAVRVTDVGKRIAKINKLLVGSETERLIEQRVGKQINGNSLLRIPRNPDRRHLLQPLLFALKAFQFVFCPNRNFVRGEHREEKLYVWDAAKRFRVHDRP
ncbi:hypothetical protein [Polaromonas sp. AER18D-145]|uniref:hypothetical protein n=1 Tax=Polaromonas sp. AER18D-145 TaxID=1977060 RepID=UPI000BBBF12D|nr:hypothetical protein [Polaromonas sp. AER18D-145]